MSKALGKKIIVHFHAFNVEDTIKGHFSKQYNDFFRNADKIIVLDNGKMVGSGTHKELLKKCKVYKEIALSQLSKEELENE